MSLSAAAADQVQLGSVHGFVFPFGSQKLTYPHPGIVVAVRSGAKDGVQKTGVIALAISHATQRVSFSSPDAILVPLAERAAMGLDSLNQWVCVFEQTVVYFPDSARALRPDSKAHLGQASEGFTKEVIETWHHFRKSGK